MYKECAYKITLVILTQVEVSLTYKCKDSLSHRDLLQYIHRTRNNNARRIETMGIHYLYFIIPCHVPPRLGMASNNNTSKTDVALSVVL